MRQRLRQLRAVASLTCFHFTVFCDHYAPYRGSVCTDCGLLRLQPQSADTLLFRGYSDVGDKFDHWGDTLNSSDVATLVSVYRQSTSSQVSLVFLQGFCRPPE